MPKLCQDVHLGRIALTVVSFAIESGTFRILEPKKEQMGTVAEGEKRRGHKRLMRNLRNAQTCRRQGQRSQENVVEEEATEGQGMRGDPTHCHWL